MAHMLRFVQDLNGIYFIEDHNDEELYVLGELLLDHTARQELLEFLENDTEDKMRLERFHFFKQPNNQYFTIEFFKPDESLLEEDNPLIVDTITRTNMLSLLQDWHDFLIKKPHTIIMQRDGDMIKLFYSAT